MDKFNNMTNWEERGLVPLYIDRLTERSIPDELDQMNKQNVFVVVLSYIVMFIYISIAMGEFSLLKSRILLSLGGILVVLFSFLASVAIVSLLNVNLSLISAEVVPFLVLAIGVDNMFIITGAKDRLIKLHPNVEVIELIGLTIEEVGPSITTASLSEFLAFIVGYLTDIPALQSFCLAAAFAVIVDYLLQVTLFLSFVTLDEHRVKANRMDILPFIKLSKSNEIPKSDSDEDVKDAEKREKINPSSRGSLDEEEDEETNLKSTTRSGVFLSEKYLDFIISQPCKIASLVIYIAMIGLSIAGLCTLSLGLDQRVTVIQESQLYNYFSSQIDFVDVGPPAYLIFNNVDYSLEENQKIIDELVDNLSQLSTVSPPVYSWYKDYSKFMDESGDWVSVCNPNINYLLTLPFDIRVNQFLKISVDSECCKKYGLCGEPYSMDINFNEEGKIIASRFRFQHIALVNQTVYVNSLIETKNTVEKYSKRLKPLDQDLDFYVNGEKVDLNLVYPYSLFYVFFDQYLYIRGVCLQNIMIAIAVIFLACQFIANIKPALVITVFVFSSVINLIGLLFLFNLLPGYDIEINAVSVVNIVLACGLSVEFIVHLVIFYLRCNSNDPVKKTKFSLRNVGISVLVGIVTTKFLGRILYLLRCGNPFLRSF